MLSPVRLSATPWTVSLQAPLSMGSPRQEYWSGLLFYGCLSKPSMLFKHIYWVVHTVTFLYIYGWIQI